jgi:hypothetical protein
MKKIKKIIDPVTHAERAAQIFLIGLLCIFIIKIIITGTSFTGKNIKSNHYELYERGSGGVDKSGSTQAQKKFSTSQ